MLRNLRGALKLQAEITPIKPDPGNAGVGKEDAIAHVHILKFREIILSNPFFV
ncbi:hypothetical protein KL86DYS1_11175 [uncultured Dysgonomonas sp.]|uniref:Uncharacterized protein n=1 Tax=uncultured Dysgonomonas sp. TaxID=206096 RepID=A0A212J5D8_9BACT|nr:hypothetical protein KL86DYS1_11175 [uncultured Dysgonomonas sp.]